MRRFIATGTIGLSLTALALAPAALSAAPATGIVKTTLTKKVVRADAQAKKLITASRACPASARQRAITTRVRRAQTKGLRSASATSLRQRHTRIATHTKRLAIAMTRCSTTGAAPVAVVPWSSTPGAPGAPGTPGAGGAAGRDGTVMVSVPLEGLGLGGLDLSTLLDGTGLPAVVSDVAVGDLLTSPLCATSGSVCVGIDPQALASALTSAVTGRVAELPLLGAILTPLLQQVNAALASGDAASLVDVQRVSDTVIRIVPTTGSVLASLVNLLASTGGLTDAPIGQLTTVR